jgi:S1-C subfamily serine protease
MALGSNNQSMRTNASAGPGRRTPALRAIPLVAVALLAAGCTAGGSSGLQSSGGTPGAPAPTVAVPASAADLHQTVVAVIQAVQPSVVEVESGNGQTQAIGSGEMIRSDGYIATNDHVVAGFSSFQVVLSNGQTLSAQLMGEAPGDDLAVLKVSKSGLRPIGFAGSTKVQVGEFVLAIGSPLGLSQSATFGIVSALNRTASESPNGPEGTLTGLIQTSAPINPGNSGGALVDLHGLLIGIPTLAAADPNAGTAANGIGFAIPSNRVKFITDQLVQNGHVTSTGQGFLGIVGTDVTPDLAAADGLAVDHGVLITGFTAAASGQSPAQQGGLKQGDIILAINGTATPDSATWAGFWSS